MTAILLELVRTAMQFVSTFEDAIVHSAPHIYVSALTLAYLQSRGNPIAYVTKIKGFGLTGDLRTQLTSGEASDVGCLAVSPDGYQVVSSLSGGVLRLWNATSHRTLREFDGGHTDLPSCVAISPCSKEIASGSRDRTVLIWDAITGSVLCEPMRGHTDTVRCIVFSPDCRRVASGSRDQTVRIWDAKTGIALVGPFRGHTEQVTCIVFSPDGNLIVSGSDDHTLRVWSAHEGSMAAFFDGHLAPIRSVAYASDGNCILSVCSRLLCMWNAETGDCQRALSLRLNSLEERLPMSGECAAFSPDGRLVVAGLVDGSMCLWDTNTGALVAMYAKTHPDRARRDGYLPEKFPLAAIAFSLTCTQVISITTNHTRHVWDVRGNSIRCLPSQGQRDTLGSSYECGTDNDDEDGISHLQGRVERSEYPPKAEILSVAFSADGKRIASGSTALRIWDALTGTPLFVCEGHRGGVRSVAFSPDSSKIVSGSDEVRLWYTLTGIQIPVCFEKSTRNAESVAFSANGTQIIASSRDGYVLLSDAETGHLIRLFPTCDKCIYAAFSPDDTRIVSGSLDGVVRVWDVETSTQLWEHGNGEEIQVVTFSPDGTQIICGSGNGFAVPARAYETKTGTILPSPFTDHSDDAHLIAFSPDGRRVVTSSLGGTSRIWDLGSNISSARLRLTLFNADAGEVWCVAIAPNGRRIVTGSHSGTIRTWDVTDEPEYPSWQAISPDLALLDVLGARLAEDGWVLGANGELLFWFTESLGATYRSPRTKNIMGASATTLDLTDFCHGESWTDCYTG